MKSAQRERGFSLIELMVVIAIGLVIAALAMPNLSRAIVTVRLRESITGVSGAVQKTRIEAVRTNRLQVARFITDVNGVPFVFVDANQDGTLQATEPQVQLARGVVPDAGPPTVFPAAQLAGIFGGTGSTLTQQPNTGPPFNVGFNQRGLPCFPNSSSGSVTSCATGIGTAGANSGFLYYFKMPSTFGDQWSALTITPSGRVRVWVLNSGTWN